MNKQLMVREFMQAAGQDTPDGLTIPSEEVQQLRVKLIAEELAELAQASKAYFEYVIETPDGVMGSRVAGEPNLEGVADALADLLYVVYGAAVAWGIQIDPVFGEVHRSNMTKFIDGHRRADGKYVKGPSYEPAKIAEVLAAQ